MNKSMIYQLNKITFLLKIDMFISGKEELISVRDSSNNPIYYSTEFRESLMKQADKRDSPVVMKDKYQVYLP